MGISRQFNIIQFLKEMMYQAMKRHGKTTLFFRTLVSDSEVKASASNEGDLGSIPGLGRSPGEGNVNPLQYSCLENPMDGGAWKDYSPQGRKELDMTERLHFHFQ